MAFMHALREILPVNRPVVWHAERCIVKSSRSILVRYSHQLVLNDQHMRKGPRETCDTFAWPSQSHIERWLLVVHTRYVWWCCSPTGVDSMPLVRPFCRLVASSPFNSEWLAAPLNCRKIVFPRVSRQQYVGTHTATYERTDWRIHCVPTTTEHCYRHLGIVCMDVRLRVRGRWRG